MTSPECTCASPDIETWRVALRRGGKKGNAKKGKGKDKTAEGVLFPGPVKVGGGKEEKGREEDHRHPEGLKKGGNIHGEGGAKRKRKKRLGVFEWNGLFWRRQIKKDDHGQKVASGCGRGKARAHSSSSSEDS